MLRAIVLAATGVSQVLYLGAVGVLGVRLLGRARRERLGPELALALHFLCCCVAAYALSGVALVAAQEPGLLPRAAIAPLLAAGQLGSGVGVWAGVAFTYLVFRRGELWARTLLGAFGMALAVGWAGSALERGFGGDVENGWFRGLYVTYTLAAVWVMVEPLRYWTRMRRRQALGLAEPVEVQRFLLWGLGSLARVGMLVAGAVPIFAPRLLAHPATEPLVFLATAGFGLVVAAAYWLTFFPTPGYLRRVARPARGAAA